MPFFSGKQELSLDVVSAADLLVCDLLSQSRERGEFQVELFAYSLLKLV
jgi:ornithine cyclodeaminase/alanine dehydrogenase-like protein (mu-crystallin family)